MNKNWNSKSGYRGVSWHAKYKKWRVSLCINCKDQFIGHFINIEDAVKAYEEACIKNGKDYYLCNVMSNEDYIKFKKKKSLKRESDYRKQFRKDNPQKMKKQSQRKRRRIKREIIAKYGGKCQCCNEDRFEFLCIDHINGGGSQHRKNLKKRGRDFYYWLLKEEFDPDKYRVLCHNCNLSYGFYGYCPHQTQGEGKCQH